MALTAIDHEHGGCSLSGQKWWGGEGEVRVGVDREIKLDRDNPVSVLTFNVTGKLK